MPINKDAVFVALSLLCCYPMEQTAIGADVTGIIAVPFPFRSESRPTLKVYCIFFQNHSELTFEGQGT